MSETFTNYSPVKINILEIKGVWKHSEHESLCAPLQSSAVKAHLGKPSVNEGKTAAVSG